MKLTPQQRLIVDYLKDGTWKCMATRDFFIKDDRKRISELNAMGYAINGKFCDGRCGIKHSARIFMRQMSKNMDGCCFSSTKFFDRKTGLPIHSRDCIKGKELINA